MPDTMPEKENLLRAITHQDPDHVPVRRLTGVMPGLVRCFYRDSRGPEQGTDRWGVRWAGGTAAGPYEWQPGLQGYPVEHPMRDLAQVESYPYPCPDEPGIMDGLLDGVDREQALVMAEVPFLLLERAYLLLGMEAFLVGLKTEPEAMHILLHRIADYQIGIIRRYMTLGVDIVRATDDYGTQTALLMSPRLWRTFIKPELARIYAVIREAGLLAFLHSCGHVVELVPDLIEVGVDCLDPVQPWCNDHAQLKRLSAGRLCFMGGANTQHALTLGSPAEVDAEVMERIRILGPGGGYILGPDNIVPLPKENYFAYLAAGERYGHYPLAA